MAITWVDNSGITRSKVVPVQRFPHVAAWGVGASPVFDEKTQPGRCRSKAHRMDTLGLRGDRVFVSGLWTGKTVADTKAERAEYVRQVLAEAEQRKRAQELWAPKPSATGDTGPEDDGWVYRPARPGDPDITPRPYLILANCAEEQRRRAEYTLAKLEHPPVQEPSAIQEAA